MAYAFHDVDGYLDPGPCINGLRQLKAFIASQQGLKFPAIEQLFDIGYTKLLAQLKIECRNLEKRATDKDIKSTLASLGKSASKAKEILIMEA